MTKNQQISKDILNASYEAGACHIGSALSCVDILVDLLYPKLDGVFLFGKASGVATYYAILADQGVFPKEHLARYLKEYPLPSTEVPGVVHSFGSVGHALSVAAGMALGNREQDVYVLLSDGDLQEGSTYEATLFASQHDLKNLYVHVDDNNLQACGTTSDILAIDYSFFESHLWNFHHHQTIKGKGVDFMENEFSWHYRNLNESLLKDALKQIDNG